MSREYKAECGCKINFVQWTAKRKLVRQESCSLHKAAPELLEALRDLMKSCENWAPMIDRSRARAAIAKAEAKV